MTDADLGGRVERWLTAEAPARAPERLVHETRARITRMPQRRRAAVFARIWQTGPRLLPIAAAAAFVLVVATALVNSPSSDRVGGPPSPSASPALASPSIASSSTFVCASGGLCAGPLGPGAHQSEAFAPAFTITVPAGWTNTLDRRGQFDLSYDAGSSYRYPDGISFHDGISIFRMPIAESSSQARPEARVGRDARALADWLAAHADIVASKPEPVAIQGVPGWRVAIGPRSGPRSKPDHCTTDHRLDRCESLFIGGDPASGFGFGIVGPESAVISFLDLPSGVTVMVVVDDVDGVDASGLISSATPVVQSVVFER